MMLRNIIRTLMEPRSFFKKFFTHLIIFALITGYKGVRSLGQNLEGIVENERGSSAAVLLDGSKISNIKKEREIGDHGSSSSSSLASVKKNNANSPALDTFLKNVLQAQDELKWIDHAVRRVGMKETQEKSPRYLAKSLEDTDSLYNSKIRSKRRLANEIDDNQSWQSTKRKYYDEENAKESQPQRVYLDREMKFKRYSNPSDIDGQVYRNFRRKQGRSNIDDGPAVDDATLEHWAEKEGLKVPGSWFEYEGSRRNVENVNQLDDSNRETDEWVDNPRDERDVGVIKKNLKEQPIAEEPSLESLKKTVLELSRSLEDSDRKMAELNERENDFDEIKNRERHVEDISGRKEGRAKGEHERATPSSVERIKDTRDGNLRDDFGSSSSVVEFSSGSNWWDDPRSAADIFDFKRRDDDEMDGEDDDEDSEAGNSEFDYAMRRVKREKDDEEGERGIRVYQRAGFGESFPEKREYEVPYERRKRSRFEKDPGENVIVKNSGEDEMAREVREGELDKIIKEENSNVEEKDESKITDVNVNESDHLRGDEVKEMNKKNVESSDRVVKNVDDDNPLEKVEEKEKGVKVVGEGTVGDSNLKDTKSACLSLDEKRSPSLRGRKEEHKQRLSTDEIPYKDDESSFSKNMKKTELDELLKNAPIEPPYEKNSRNQNGEKNSGGKIKERKTKDEKEETPKHVEKIEEIENGKEVEKSDQSGDDVHKFSENTNDKKKNNDENEKNLSHDQSEEEIFTDQAPRKSDDGNEIESQTAANDHFKMEEAKLETDVTKKINEDKAKSAEEPINVNVDKELNAVDKTTADHKDDSNPGNGDNHSENFSAESKPKSGVAKESNDGDSKLTKLDDPRKELNSDSNETEKTTLNTNYEGDQTTKFNDPSKNPDVENKTEINESSQSKFTISYGRPEVSYDEVRRINSEKERERGKDDERKYKDEESSYDDEDKRLIGYSKKDNTKYHPSMSNYRDESLGENFRVESKNDKLQDSFNYDARNPRYENTRIKDVDMKKEELTRKLLWLPDIKEDGGEDVEIRDGRRDSAWDQKYGGKTGQRPANFFKNVPSTGSKNNKRSSKHLVTRDTNNAAKNSINELKFVKRSLMVANENSSGRRLKKRRAMTREMKRSAKTYPENMEDDNAMEEVAREDKDEVHKSGSRKRSVEKISDYEKQSENGEKLYGVKEEGNNRENDVKVSNEDEENQSMESENQAELSLARLEHKEGDRDPIKDRINMLIKQKLDDRSKGKMAHLKREASYALGNIEYYDYDSDISGGEPEMNPAGVDYDQRQNLTLPEGTADNLNASCSPSNNGEPISKKDENSEVQRMLELENSKLEKKVPNQEFISDSGVDNAQKKKPPGCDAIKESSSVDDDQHRYIDDGTKNIFPGMEPNNDNNNNNNNEIRENDATKSNYNHWLGQPIEAKSEEQDSRNVFQGRYQNTGDSVDREKTVENEKNEVLGEPIEYSVKVRGKIDPESIDAILKEKPNAREDIKDLEKSHISQRFDERDRDEELENERRNDKLMGEDEHWRIEELRDGKRLRNDQGQADEELDGDRGDQPYSEKKSRSNWRYRDLDRIEEGNNSQGSSQEILSRNIDDQDQILEEKNNSKDTGDQDLGPREVRLAEESAGDSLPTMLDRSGPSFLAPGEKTYLVVTPATQIQCPRKTIAENSSTSGSNYLALKVTDDMFKGGLEQSNPADEKITESNVLGLTSTEWKVIEPGEEAKIKPLAFQEIDNKNFYPQDVLHESFVDPNEMAADFDDDLMPRLGRSLQSVSYAVDKLEGENFFGNGERPVEKYLENAQFIDFENLNKFNHGINKRSVNIIDDNEMRKTSDTNSNIKSEEQKSGVNDVPSEYSDRKISMLNFPAVNEEPNLTRINGLNVGEEKEELKMRSLEDNTDSVNRGVNQIDKDNKRGLTNVEEWEMNSPSVQKQRTSITLVGNKNFDDDLSLNEGKKSIVSLNEINNEKKALDSFSKPDENSSVNINSKISNESHERESRSIKLKDENSRFVDEKNPSERRGEKIRRKLKSSNWVSNSRVNYEGNRGNLRHDWRENLRDKKRRSWEKSNGKNSPVHRNHRSKGNEHWHQHIGHRKIVNENAANRRHSLQGLKKHRSSLAIAKENRRNLKTPLKSSKDRKEIRHFKDVRFEKSAIRNAKGHHDVSMTAFNHPRDIYGESFDAGKSFDVGMITEDRKKVLDENAQDANNVKRDDEAQKKKFTVLLAADNMEDESQMDLALHGELAGKIVERIFDQVQKNDALKVALGPGLFRKHKSEDAVTNDKIYRQGLDEDEVKHTEAMMRRVMELLGKLILDEVQRKTCASLPPDMREFLQWMLGVEDENSSTNQIPPLPPVHNDDQNHRQCNKFLFEGPIGRNENPDVDELNKKVKLLKSLIDEYNSLSTKEKTRVQTVHDYLVKQLELLKNYIESKESEGNKQQTTETGIEGGAGGGGNILQYQNPMPDRNRTSYSRAVTLSPLVNLPSILMLSNASFVIDQPVKPASTSYDSRRRNARSSGHPVEKRHRKGKHRKHKRPHHHHHRHHLISREHNYSKKNEKNGRKLKGGESIEYKKLIRKAAMLRKKRANNLYEDKWDPVDSGYEEPKIYTSSGELTGGSEKERRSIRRNRKSEGSGEEGEEKTNDPYYWADVLSGKLNDEEGEELGENLESDSPQIFESINESLTSLDDFGSGTKITETTSSRMENPKENENIGPIESPQKLVKKGTSSAIQQIKRDVIDASIGLQPWMNKKSGDLVPAEYLNELTNELVHGSLTPRTREDGEKKRETVTKARNLADDELMLLSKREAWRAENEQQLEEVAFGKDMRGKWKEKERFEELKGMDRKKKFDDVTRRKKREDEEKGFESDVKSVSKNEMLNVKPEDKIKIENVPATEINEVKSDVDKKYSDEEVQVTAAAISEMKITDSENLNNSRETTTETENGLKKEETKVEEKEEGGSSGGSLKSFGSFEKSLKIEREEGEKTEESEDLKKIQKVEGTLNNMKRNSFELLKKGNDDTEKRNSKRSSPFINTEVEGSAILPLLEISEQRQQQKQAAKTEKDDQRDIADQMLGFESPLIIVSNAR